MKLSGGNMGGGAIKGGGRNGGGGRTPIIRAAFAAEFAPDKSMWMGDGASPASPPSIEPWTDKHEDQNNI